MSCCSALLLLVCGSLAVSHPDFWTTSTTSSPGTGGRISSLERSRWTGRNMDQMAFGGKYQPKGNSDAVSQDVTIHFLLPTYFCPLNRLRCSSTVRSSRRRSLPKNVVPNYLYVRIGRAVIEQALEGRYPTIRKTRPWGEDK